MTNLDSILKSRDFTLPAEVCLVKAVVFPSSHVWMWELDCKESWVLKNWYFWTVVLEKTLESLMDIREIQPVNPKRNQSWTSIGRTDAEAETPIVWPPDAKNWLIWEDPDGWERLKAGGEGDNRGWDGWMASPTQWTWVWGSSGVGDGQGGLAYCSPWDHKESEMTEWLNWTEDLETTNFCIGKNK